MPRRPDPYIDFLLEQLSPLGEIQSRAMFGGYCLYCNGTVFALVANGGLFLKADTYNRAAFEQRKLKPFKPFPDREEVMSYYEAPPEIFEDPDQMQQWCGAAVEAGRRATSRKTTKKGARKKSA